MGGCGSGRIGWSTTLEDCLNLDIRWLKKHNVLEDGKMTIVTLGGRSQIGYGYQDNQVILVYAVTNRETNVKENFKQDINITYTDCHLGGQRPWFSCPYCHLRVAKLYLASNSSFYCRTCLRLPYRSTLQTSEDRSISQTHKLGHRIYENYNPQLRNQKKKGMHWKTFLKLEREFIYKEQRMLRRVAVNIEKIKAQLAR